jgi:hypothetical protein
MRLRNPRRAHRRARNALHHGLLEVIPGGCGTPEPSRPAFPERTCPTFFLVGASNSVQNATYSPSDPLEALVHWNI